jgi:hypothetical protein
MKQWVWQMLLMIMAWSRAVMAEATAVSPWNRGEAAAC